MIFLPRLALLLSVLVGGASLAAWAQSSEGAYSLNLELWVDGERQRIDQDLVVTGSPSVLKTNAGYRFEFSLSELNDAFAPEDTFWLNIELYEQDPTDLEWVFVMDTVLGAALGRPQTFSLAGSDQPVTKRNAALYLIVEVDKK